MAPHAIQRGWAGIPPDLLHLVYRRLPNDPRSYAILRSVCKSWRLTFSHLGVPPPRDPLPWLLECEQPWVATRILSSPEDGIHYYSPFSGSTGTLHLRDGMNSATVYNGPGNGHLILAGENRQLCLVNPLNGRTQPLPNLPPGLLISSMGCSTPKETYLLTRSMQLDNLWSWEALMYNQNLLSWTFINLDQEECQSLCATFCAEGSLYTTEGGHVTAVYDTVSRLKSGQIQPVQCEHQVKCSAYLVRTSQDLLRVTMVLASDGHDRAEDCTFVIHKLEPEEGGQIKKWTEISNLEEETLFLQMDKTGFALRPQHGMKANEIYFIHMDGKPYKCNILTGLVERLCCPFDYSVWFVPHM